jgi:hypothetical protein
VSFPQFFSGNPGGGDITLIIYENLPEFSHQYKKNLKKIKRIEGATRFKSRQDRAFDGVEAQALFPPFPRGGDKGGREKFRFSII